MTNRVEEAEKLFKEGYNCSQAVFAAFSDLYGIDRDTALRLASSFGGGFGRMREVCGAVSGMCMVAGLESGSAMIADNQGKKHNYEIVRKLSEEFKEINGSMICRELLGMDNNQTSSATPSERTSEYYRKRPCVELVKEAARITENFLFEIKLLPVLTEDEIHEVSALADIIWHEHYNTIIGKSQVDYMIEKFQSPKAMKEQMNNEGYHYYKIVNTDGLAGYYAYRIMDEGLFLSKIYIARKYRGRGYSHKVMDFLQKCAKEAGHNKIWLTVNKNNSSSIEAYQKLGFQKIRVQVADIGSGFVMDDYIMEKIVP